MKKVLLLPSYLGGGFGHIGRCLALAAELKDRAWDPAFALGGYHAARVARAGHRVYILRRPFVPRPESSEGPAFTVFSNLGYQLVRDGLHTPRSIRACLSEQLGVLRSFKPDLLISDSWPLARMLAHLTGLPLVQLVRSATHPAAPNLIWWQDAPADLQPPDPRPVFNPLMESLGLDPIQRAEDLLQGDIYLVPSFPELDPLPGGLAKTEYVGPLTRSLTKDQVFPPRLEQFAGDWPLVYITLGGGAGPVGGPQFYRRLFCAFEDLPVRVLASTGSRLSPDDLPTPPDNFRLESWLPGQAVIARSSLVVYPGGYGTTMELVQAGVPGLIIPFHTEQESNGRRLEASGAARLLLPADDHSYQVAQNWAGGHFTYVVYPHSNLAAPTIRLAVQSVLNDSSFQKNAARLQELAANYGGSIQAGDLIESLVSSRDPDPARGWDRLSWWQKLSLSTFSPTVSQFKN